MIKDQLVAGSYMPHAVRRVDIPKPQGGVRTFGIPTLTDRPIQQALHEVLQAIFEARFSASSYGFRPGRNAHQTVKVAQQHVSEDRRYVVDIDLEKQRLTSRVRELLEKFDGWDLQPGTGS